MHLYKIYKTETARNMYYCMRKSVSSGFVTLNVALVSAQTEIESAVHLAICVRAAVHAPQVHSMCFRLADVRVREASEARRARLDRSLDAHCIFQLNYSGRTT